MPTLLIPPNTSKWKKFNSEVLCRDGNCNSHKSKCYFHKSQGDDSNGCWNTSYYKKTHWTISSTTFQLLKNPAPHIPFNTIFTILSFLAGKAWINFDREGTRSYSTDIIWSPTDLQLQTLRTLYMEHGNALRHHW